MLIITTIYVAESEDRARDDAPEATWQEAADLKDASRQWVSIYEGKNRVLPMDAE